MLSAVACEAACPLWRHLCIANVQQIQTFQLAELLDGLVADLTVIETQMLKLLHFCQASGGSICHSATGKVEYLQLVERQKM